MNDGERLTRLFQEIEGLMKHRLKDHFDGLGLTMPQIAVLGILCKDGNMKIGDISEKMNLSNSTISGIVDRLEKMEFVERARSQDDRRVVMVQPTPKLDEFFNKLDSYFKQYFEGLMNGCSKEDVDTVIRGFEKFVDILKR